MLSINLRMTIGGVERDIHANPADIVAFETKFNVPFTVVTKEPRMSHLLYIAWHSQKRTGATQEPFEKWCEAVESIDGGADPK